MKELQAYCTYFVAGEVLMTAYILHDLKSLPAVKIMLVRFEAFRGSPIGYIV